MPMVRCFHLALSFPGAAVLVDVHFAVTPGELVLVTGEAGAGKTTLVRLLLGLEVPRRGWVTVGGFVLDRSSSASLAAHRRRVALMPQAPALVARMSALENVALSLEVARIPAAEARRRAGLALERVGVTHLAGRRAGVLSGGEQRWVAIARALARTDAPLLIADEPAAGLGDGDRALLGALLEEERGKGKTVIALSRDPFLPGAREVRVLGLAHGRATEGELRGGHRRAHAAEAV